MRARHLRLGEALIAVGARAPRHLIIDPFQESAFANAGWELLEAAALHPTTRLIREPSSVALPQLVAEAVAADAAFIDGSHRFHEVFVDLYFLRKIVRPGGLVVVDDYDWPSVQTAVRYFEINMGWRSLDDTFAAGSTAAGSIDETKSIPRLRALRLPDPPFETPFELFKPF
ncbi:MAG TPA: class I SAM-dependent methyltransferase [Polyangiaceae bacterium]